MLQKKLHLALEALPGALQGFVVLPRPAPQPQQASAF